MHKVFVYGTLKRGYTANAMLLADAEYIGEFVTTKKYRMYDLGPFPSVIQADDGHYIMGEIYEVDDDTLIQLDTLEGVPRLYARGETVCRPIIDGKLVEGEDNDITAFIYTFNQEIQGVQIEPKKGQVFIDWQRKHTFEVFADKMAYIGTARQMGAFAERIRMMSDISCLAIPRELEELLDQMDLAAAVKPPIPETAS